MNLPNPPDPPNLPDPPHPPDLPDLPDPPDPPDPPDLLKRRNGPFSPSGPSPQAAWFMTHPARPTPPPR